MHYFMVTCPLDYAKCATLCGRLNSSNGRPLEEKEKTFHWMWNFDKIRAVIIVASRIVCLGSG
jgi:hypothetical protein